MLNSSQGIIKLIFSLTALSCPNDQTEEFMFQNVAYYGPTVNKTVFLFKHKSCFREFLLGPKMSE